MKGIPDGFDVVKTPSGIGNGHYDACGKCGARLHTGVIAQDARDGVTKGFAEMVIEPLALLAGVLSGVNEDEEHEIGLRTAGRLLGLVVYGAKKELEIQKMGGFGAYWITRMLDDHEKQTEVRS